MRGADLLVKALANAGVDTIFTLSGNQIMPIFDACIDAGIEVVHVRHEGAAVYMAEGYAQVTGRLGVALVTAAPGFGNAVGSIYMARMSESPVLLLSGDSPRGLDGRGAFQELDQVAVSKGVSKWSYRPQRAAELGADIATAVRTATTGRPGPVHLALPFDLLDEDVGDVEAPPASQCQAAPCAPDPNALASVFGALKGAAKPIVLTGPLLNNTRTQGRLGALEEALDAPVIAMESPRGLNDPSLGQIKSVLDEADLVLSLGKNVDFTTGFGQSGPLTQSWIVIDPDEELVHRASRSLGSKLTQSVQASARTTFEQMLSTPAGASARGEWRARVHELISARAPQQRTATELMHPADLCAALQPMIDAAEDPILIIDGGEFGQWAQACLSGPARLINGPSGAIGGCLCYAAAAKVARPDSTVFLLMGDGTAGFHFSEFDTAARHSANFVAIIGHDSKWNAEVQIQMRDYGENRLLGCELAETRYDMAAKGLGAHGEWVEKVEDLEPAVNRSLASGKPACIAVKIEGVAAPSGH